MSQQFCLKWNNHMNNMMDVFKNLLSTEAMVDVTLACDGLSLKAHKIVLSACSPFFQSLFLENPCKHPIVILKDMKYTELKAIIEFMYHGEVNVAQDQLSALMKTAETLRVKGLAEVTNEKQSNSQDDSSQHRSVPRTDTPPPSKRRRGRTRKRSISDQSEDDTSEPKIKQPDSDIEELSGDMDASSSQYSNLPSTVPMQSISSHSTNSFHKQSQQQQDQPVDQGADESFAPEEKFGVEPSKLLEQTLTTDDLPRRSGRSSVQSNMSNMEIQRRPRSSTDHSSSNLVPTSMPSDALVPANQQPESPPDIKPELLELDPPMSPVAGPSHSTDENSMMMYMDQSSMSGMPGPSGYQDNSALVSTDSQPQEVGKRCYVNMQAIDKDVHINKRSHQIKEYSNEKENSNDEDIRSSTANEYEEKVKKARAERIEFLKLLKINEVKADLKETVSKIKKVEKSHKKTYKKCTYERVQRTLRILDHPVDYSEKSIFNRMMLKATVGNRKIIPPVLEFEKAILEGAYSKYVEDMHICKPKFKPPHLIYDKFVLENFTLKESNIVQITAEEIMSLAWYPSSENIILAAGNNYGNLGIWNGVSKSSPYEFKIHLDGITHLAFNPYNPIQLISSSYDGTLRSGDMEKHVFNEIYNISDEGTACRNFDFVSSTTYLVVQNKGEVALIDTRTKGTKCEKSHYCHKFTRCVNVHPVNKDMFLTGGSFGSIRLWDLRNLQVQPVVEMVNHQKCIQAAYFSPVSGNSILSTSLDRICISDCPNFTDVKVKTWVKFKDNSVCNGELKATWLPHSDENFSVGNMVMPQQIRIYDKNFNVYHSVMHENFVCAPIIDLFHPFKPLIVASNKRKMIYMFTNLE